MRVLEEDLVELVELVDEQLRMTPAERLEYLLGDGYWPACRQVLRVAAAVRDEVVLVGPVAVALRGGPQQPGDGRVDLLCDAAAQDDVALALFDAGAGVGRLWRAGSQPAGEVLQELPVGDGMLTLRTAAAGVTDIAAVIGRGELVDVAGSVVRVAGLDDLIDVTFASPWSQDGPYRSGLRALRARRDATPA